MTPLFQPITLLEALEGYTADERRVFQMLAALGFRLDNAQILKMLHALSWNAGFVDHQWLNLAVTKGLLKKEKNFYTVNSMIAEYLSQQLSYAGAYVLVQQTAKAAIERVWCLHLKDSTKAYHRALYSGDFQTVYTIMEISDEVLEVAPYSLVDMDDIVSVMVDWTWLHRLPDHLKFQFLYQMLLRVERGLADAYTLSEVRQELESSSSLIQEVAGVALLARILVWQGEFTRAKALLSAAGKGSEAFELRGRLAFLSGEGEKAFEFYRKALFRKRKESGDRRTGLNYEDMLFHIMACMRDQDVAKNSAFIRTTKARKSTHDDHSVLTTVLEKVLAVRSLGQQWPDKEIQQSLHSLSESPFSSWCFCLGVCWLGRKLEEFPLLLKSVKQAHDYANAHQMHWLLWEFKQMADGGFISNTLLEQTGTLQESTALPRKLIQQQVEAAGVVSCLSVIPLEMAWERGLKALNLLKEGPATSGDKAQRMVWLFFRNKDWQGHTTLMNVEPRLQSLNKNGKWGRGRKVSIKHLVASQQRQQAYPFLSKKDLLICDCIESIQYGYYYDDDITLDADEALAAAADHPLLFMNDVDTPLSVTKQAVTLKVVPENGLIHISLDPFPEGGLEIDEQGALSICWPSPHEAVVTNFTSEQLNVAQVLGENGLYVPESAKEQALESVASVAPLVTVHSAVEGEGHHAATKVEADSRLHLHLQPLANGLQISCYVRPFGDAPLLLHPAEGGRTVFTDYENQTLQTRRDLETEAKRAAKLFNSCTFLDADEGWEWLLDEPQQALQTLEEFHAMADDLELAWPEGKAIKIAKKLELSQFNISMNSQQDWFEIEGDVQVNEAQVLSLKQLLDLVQASPGRFIRLGEEQVLSLSSALYQRLEAIQSVTDKGRFHGLAASAIEEMTDGMQVKKNRKWQAQLKKLSDAEKFQPQLPSTLQAELRDYQLEGFEWMARLSHWGAGACLADDMGLGKTMQALALILSHAAEGPTLVVAPTSVCINWQAEVVRFAPTLKLHYFAEGNRADMMKNAGPFDLIVCSYALLQRNGAVLAACNWQTVVLDEAQAIKNGMTKRSKAAMALQSQVRLITTGTPIENHLGELWNLFQFINPGLLGSLEHFTHRFANPIQQQNDSEAGRRLKQLMHPFILRRLKSEVLPELPSRTEITMHVELSKEEMTLYEVARRQALERIHDSAGDQPGGGHIKVLAEIMRLRQACCHPSLIMPDCKISGSKLAAFGECVEELIAGGHKALVFSQFVGHLHILRSYLESKTISYQYLDGSTPIKERKRRMDAFQAGEGDIFLISLKAGGAGLNLTAADYVLHMDPWWNPAVEDQASDRAHRIGQTRPVTIYRFIAKGTIEDKIVQMHRQKRDLADTLLEGSDSGGKLSLHEIMRLVEESGEE
ncbi:MAG: DEAD/DEAH box helicase [Mariprofundus sp.]|nr:DEAD/DEAH box helicase [Mariprofundus sp.]